MSTHNLCFHAEIRKLSSEYPLLSGAMVSLSGFEPLFFFFFLF